MDKNINTNTPHLLFCCDFPPCESGGGAILVSRLLSTYPSDRTTVITSARALKLSSTKGRLQCEHILFPRTNRLGRWGWGRIKEIVDWLLFPYLIFKITRVLKQKQVQVMVTIAHGDFVLAVAIVSLMTGAPFIMLVHDDWIDNMTRGPSYLRWFGPRRIFSAIARKASQVYVVSPYMQTRLKSQCGVISDLQMPAIEQPKFGKCISLRPLDNGLKTLRIVYAGNGFGTDCLNLLVSVIKHDKLKAYGIKACELHLYMPIDLRQLIERGWQQKEVIVHGWVSQKDLQMAFKEADILFLPFSFESDQRVITETSFPTKTSDYLAAEKPILICAPPYSSGAKYAAQQGFAEVVNDLNEDALVQGITKIWASQDYREHLRMNARLTFDENHNMEKQRKDFVDRVRQIVGLE